ncbi:MAG: hypothetical protein HZB33_02400 [Nitrospirae bacterium]|nr:hypothetical protein [Nitrospirota bacterium]
MIGSVHLNSDKYGPSGIGESMSQGLSGEKRVCPFVSGPFENCYCRSTSSMFVESTIKFCGGDFEKCEIYCHNKTHG